MVILTMQIAQADPSVARLWTLLVATGWMDRAIIAPPGEKCGLMPAINRTTRPGNPAFTLLVESKIAANRITSLDAGCCCQ